MVSMITNEQLSLMTAGIDGDLTPKQARRLRRLLDSSAEARAVYERLQADSYRLRKLPRVPAPADLHKRVMAQVATVSPAPVPPPAPAPVAVPSPAPATLPFRPKGRRWIPVAVAASTLLAITG